MQNPPFSSFLCKEWKFPREANYHKRPMCIFANREEKIVFLKNINILSTNKPKVTKLTNLWSWFGLGQDCYRRLCSLISQRVQEFSASSIQPTRAYIVGTTSLLADPIVIGKNTDLGGCSAFVSSVASLFFQLWKNKCWKKMASLPMWTLFFNDPTPSCAQETLSLQSKSCQQQKWYKWLQGLLWTNYLFFWGVSPQPIGQAPKSVTRGV